MKLNEEDLPSADGEWEYDGRYLCWHSKLNGCFHNSLGPAIVYDDGSKQWYINGKLHRLEGPAVEYDNGQKEWWVDGKIHRLDGPAVEYSNGQKEWYVNDVHLRKKDFSSAVISFLLGVDSEMSKLIEQEMKL